MGMVFIDMKTKTDDFRFLDVPRAMWYFLDSQRYKFLLFTGTLTIALFYEMLPPYLIGSVVDFLTSYTKGADLKPLFIPVAILSVSSALVAILRLKSKENLGKYSINARYNAKVWGFGRLLDFSLDWHQKESTGNKAQRILTGSESLRIWTQDFNNVILPAITSFIGSLIACLLLNPIFIVFFVYYLTVLLVTEIVFDRRISNISDKVNKSMENASGAFVESASNILAVKALGANRNMTSSIQVREKTAQDLSNKRLSMGVKKWMIFQAHNSVSWGIFILLVAYMVMHGKLTVGFVLTYTQYFASLRMNATQFTNQFQVMIERKSELGRMMPIFWQDHSLHDGDENFPEDWDEIALEDASFQYEEAAAISSINLRIRRGEKIGIAGHSGSGKSTLIKLFLGLYHVTNGSFRIGGTELAAIRNEDITSTISVVLQETELFNMSLRDNITLMKSVPEETIESACYIACLNDLIERLPRGMDTVIGEKGYALSGGERQRVGIARAICKQAEIFLLDEATSALDSATEAAVMERLMGAFAADKTMLIVAHRISTLKDSDRILVFERGKIVEQGVFDELKADASSRFGAMYRQQA